MDKKGDIIKSYLKDREGVPTLTIAKKIYSENKEVFSNLEACRCLIRYWRSNAGDSHRKSVSDKTYARENGGSGDYNYPIPESIDQIVDWKIFKLQNVKNVLILPDMQIPFHDSKAIECTLKYGKDNGADCIVFNGDTLDVYCLSKFNKDPRLRHLAEERDIALRILDAIRERFPDAKIIFNMGNHEERLESYMWHKADELYGIKEFEIEKLYKFDEFEIEINKNKQPIKLGHLFIIHGHEFGSGISVPVNPARTFYLKAKTCVIGSHYHVQSEHSVKDLNQKVIASWPTGCLCDLHPKYRPLNEWSHGFAFIRMTDTMNFKVDNLKIIDNEVY